MVSDNITDDPTRRDYLAGSNLGITDSSSPSVTGERIYWTKGNWTIGSKGAEGLGRRLFVRRYAAGIPVYWWPTLGIHDTGKVYWGRPETVPFFVEKAVLRELRRLRAGGR
jgi:hypothetical protein